MVPLRSSAGGDHPPTHAPPGDTGGARFSASPSEHPRKTRAARGAGRPGAAGDADDEARPGGSAPRGSPGFRRVLAFVAGWNAACWLVLGSLLVPVTPGGWVTVLGVATLLVLPVVVLGRAIGGGLYPSPATRIWVFRPFWYGQLFLPLLALAGLAGLALGLPFGTPVQAGRWAVSVVAVGLGIIAIVGYVGTRRLVVRPIELGFASLPPAFDGLRIAQISDLHVGPHTSRRHLARVVKAVEEARPDVIAYTGDQVDDYARDMEPFADALSGFSPPVGAFAIPGNHDIIAGWYDVRAGLEAMGITVLVNDGTPVERGGERIWIVGTGDPAGNGWRRGGGAGAAPDIGRTLDPIPASEFTIALAHNPELWPALAARGVDLTLSGHTHYGQFSIPGTRWSMASLFLDLSMGVYERDGSVLYISCGTNFWGIPLRIGDPAEVAVITLRRRAAEG